MPKPKQPAPAERGESDILAEAIDRLTDELSALRDVMDRLSEDVSWVTRNCLPVQLLEPPSINPAAPVEAPTTGNEAWQQGIAESLVESVEAVAQGQLEIVLTALDGVQQQLLQAIAKHSNRDSLPKSTKGQPRTKPEPPRATSSGEPSADGRLF